MNKIDPFNTNGKLTNYYQEIVRISDTECKIYAHFDEEPKTIYLGTFRTYSSKPR